MGTYIGAHMKIHMDSFIKSYGKIGTRNGMGIHVGKVGCIGLNMGHYVGSA